MPGQLRVACLQFEPVHSDIEASQARADALLAGTEPNSADVLVLPELALCGYLFRDAEQIAPLAERVGDGPTTRWASACASRLQCAVVVGFVETEAGRLYNSQLVVSSSGAVLACHRKAHLFAADETWATEGSVPGTSFLLPVGDRTVKCALGICMDINPKGFTAPFHAYELAVATLAADAAVLLFSSAWCDRSPLDAPDYVPPPVRALETQRYWATRLAPLQSDSATRYFVCADRIGKEASTTFCGSSCVMAMGHGRVKLLATLNEREDGVLLHTCTL
jgi:protein N-terminal amidase